jgi:mono/diheme cytochrome c family protein
MKRRIFLLFLAVLILPLAVSAAFAQDDEQGDDRGAYLATVAGCAYCHSPADGPVFIGGEFNINGETLYAPNITPAESGIGGWSDEELLAAITMGVGRDGEPLHPAMPYLYYNGMVDDDLDALIAYLRILPTVESDPLPAKDRTGVVIPSVPDRPAAVTVPDRQDESAYGAYLVDSVLACGVCHTPNAEDGTPDAALYLAGDSSFEGPWGTVYAPNITPDTATGIGWMTSDQIILSLISGQHPEESRPLYAMPSSAYATLSGRDVQAVETYLVSVPAVINVPPINEIAPGFDTLPQQEREPPTIIEVITTGLMFLVVLAVAVYLSMRQMQLRKRVRDTDWEGHFREVLRDSREERDEQSPQD